MWFSFVLSVLLKTISFFCIQFCNWRLSNLCFFSALYSIVPVIFQHIFRRFFLKVLLLATKKYVAGSEGQVWWAVAYWLVQKLSVTCRWFDNLPQFTFMGLLDVGLWRNSHSTCILNFALQQIKIFQGSLSVCYAVTFLLIFPIQIVYIQCIWLWRMKVEVDCL